MLRGISKDRTSEYPLSCYKDLKREQTLSDGSELLSFNIPKKYANNLELESYIQTEYQEYVVKEVNPDGEFYEVVTKLNLEKFWGKMWKNFENVEATITDTLNLALAGTGWVIGTCGITKKRTIRKTNSSTLDIINQCLKTYLAEIEYDTLNKVINIYEKRGNDKGKFAMDTVNAKKITLQASSYEYITKLICIGATTTTKDNDDNETSTTLEVTVTNNTYSNKDIAAIWKDERYTVEADLREDGQAKLDELAKPVESYSVDFAFLDDVSVGDTITLISKENNIFKKLRVVKLTTYPDDPQKAPTGELGSRIYSFEDMQKQYEDTTSTVTNITADDGSISSSALKDAFNKLVLAELDVATLNALDARIGQLEATYVTTTELVAERANIKNAVIEQLNADDIYAKRADITVLSSNVANINTLLAGTVTTGSTQTIVLNSQNTTIENALIKSAMIESLDVSKINSGTISTNKFTIQSNDGAITIADSTMQFKDNNDNIRIQMGQDASGNFSFIIRASDGTTTLIDGTGVKENAIADKLIKTNMINDKAITKDKIDYTSFVEGYNASTNTNTIKASKVLLDGTTQTLDVKFNTLETTLNDLSIGGVNKLINGGFNYSSFSWKTNGSLSYEVISESSAKSGKALKMYCGGADNGIYQENIDSATGYITISFYAKADYNDMAIHFGVQGFTDKAVNLTTGWKRYTYTIKCGVVNNKKVFIYPSQGAVIYLHSVKAEEGNMATDFNYNPVEVDSRIKSNSTSISTMQGQISTLITECEQISTNTGNITSLSIKYTQLNQDLNSFKTTVSSTYATNTTVSDLSSTVTQLNNSITTKVWQNDIDTSISALTIDTVNLINNSNFANTNYWNLTEGISAGAGTSGCNGVSFYIDTTNKRLHCYGIANGTSAIMECYQQRDDLATEFKKGCKVVFSCKDDYEWNSNSKIQLLLRGYNSNWGQLWEYTLNKNNPVTIGANSSLAKVRIIVKVSAIDNTSGSIFEGWFTNLMLQYGDKVTKYSLNDTDYKDSFDKTNTRISSVEQEITSTAITTKISTGLSGTDSISNTYFTMNNEGLTIKNGGIKILNNANTEVLACDTNGDLTLKGTFASYSNNKLACKIEENQYKLYDFSSDDETYIGALGALIQTKDNKVYKKIGLYDSYDSSICIGYDTASEANNYTHKIYAYMQFDSNNSIERVMPIEIFKDTAIRYGVRFAALDTTNKKLTGFFTTDEQDNFVLTNYNTPKFTNYLRLGTNVNYTNYYTAIEIHRQGDQEFIDGYGTFTMYGDFTVTGNKNCLQQTENYGGRLFYSLEDCSSYLTDRVDVPVQVDENKQIKVEFNEIFKECVNLTNYQITVNKETYGDYTIVEKTKDYFILESDTEGFKFTYTITAKRKGYEDRYLDEFKAS